MDTYQTNDDVDSLSVELSIDTPTRVPIDENYQSEEISSNEKEFSTPVSYQPTQQRTTLIPLITLNSVRYYRNSTLSNTLDEERQKESRKMFTGILLLIPIFLGAMLLYYLLKS